MMVMMIKDHGDDNDEDEADDDEDVDSVHGDLIQRAGQSKNGCERVPPYKRTNDGGAVIGQNILALTNTF